MTGQPIGVVYKWIIIVVVIVVIVFIPDLAD